MNDEDARRVGRWVAQARDVRGMRQIDLAVAANVSTSQLSLVERGIQGPRGWNTATLTGIERGLGVPQGTLQRVGAGEDVPLTMAAPETVTDDELIGVVRRMADRLDALERRLDALDQPRPRHRSDAPGG